ncbi:hypothetical protein NLG97_g2750 [Lecanicillium saksenae]|uniref:Uncharacterized protein n=1 Tax=Lecanicillium saksenae TaxID=468837 RepID=A0ACC1R1U1_9HYPO|nr:hypothetical protein NLG97_g2750 [Lecanicillium saksenae]
MHLSSTVAVIATLVGASTAAVSGTCKCGSNSYNQNDVVEAFVAASTAEAKKAPIKGFPKAFTNSPDNIKFDPATRCTTGPFVQFPLLKGSGFNAKDWGQSWHVRTVLVLAFGNTALPIMANLNSV